jgi:hypothetical protein
VLEIRSIPPDSGIVTCSLQTYLIDLLTPGAPAAATKPFQSELEIFSGSELCNRHHPLSSSPKHSIRNSNRCPLSAQPVDNQPAHTDRSPFTPRPCLTLDKGSRFCFHWKISPLNISAVGHELARWGETPSAEFVSGAPRSLFVSVTLLRRGSRETSTSWFKK